MYNNPVMTCCCWNVLAVLLLDATPVIQFLVRSLKGYLDITQEKLFVEPCDLELIENWLLSDHYPAAMDAQLMNFDGLNDIDSQIGCLLADGSFVVGPECSENLEELIQLLQSEDPITHPVRCRLAFMDIIKQVLVPLLLNLDEVEPCERDMIFMLVMKILAHLTQPTDCLFPDQHVSASNRMMAREMENFITKTQLLFTKPDVNRAILSEDIRIMQKNGFEKPLNDMLSDAINYTFYFYRNLLHPTEKPTTHCSLPVKITITRWLMAFGLKDILLQAVTSPQLDFWSGAVVQLLSLMFSDDRCMEDPLNGSDTTSFLRTQSLLSRSDSCCNLMNAMSDSSIEDFADARGMDTTEGAAAATAAKNKQEAEKEMDCEEQQLFEEARLNKKVDDANAWNQIRAGVTSFCSEFLRKGWLPLLKCVKSILLNQQKNVYQLQPQYFMWMLQNFGQMMQLYNTPFHCIREGLGVDTVGFLVFHVVRSFEHLKIAKDSNHNLAPFLKQTLLPLVALHQVFNTISHYWESCEIANDKIYLLSLMGYLTGLGDLSMLFIQLANQVSIEKYGKTLQREVILTTHKFLLMADLVRTHGGPSQPPLDLLSYVPHFANSHTMLQYSQILSDFKDNSSLLNQSIFTMMHHVAGECNQPQSLLQAPIIQTFINILDIASSSIPQEGHDLIEFILQKWLDINPISFISLFFENDAKTQTPNNLKAIDAAPSASSSSSSAPEVAASKDDDYPPWTADEVDELLALASQQETDSPDIQDISSKLQDICIDKSYKHIMVELSRHGLLSSDKMIEQLNLPNKTAKQDQNLESLISLPAELRIEKCTEHLLDNGRKGWLTWLQSSLLEAIYVRVIPDIRQIRPKEPVFWHSYLLDEPSPFVPYTRDQESAVKDPYFLCLLDAVVLFALELEKKEMPVYRTETTSRSISLALIKVEYPLFEPDITIIRSPVSRNNLR
ncbi:hypothetical protein CAPTEDRAFT_202856 [Capitella teleta]|uniref:Timeless N-terminal domain-containing protein n=1 Tax=Capitella teleta TaxID=283909 RepID=R7UIT3_CAPTE|nr:hypothetical protein CAPTEDRAFT_202856 [Capitella teleta]|eukprot:ELU06070.1 hypothetical protein CAPTEDRAFT_202856 [Capitella teleta]